MARWARPMVDRHQIQLFSPTLDEMIAGDHPVRLFDEILRSLDWSVWESYYVFVHGQPPIHPRILASVIKRCLKKGATQRTIDRDKYEPLGEDMDERLRSEPGHARYGLRRPLAEGPIGVLKQVLGLRQFLVRGLANVRIELTWAASAFNLRKIIKHLAALRDPTADPALP